MKKSKRARLPVPSLSVTSYRNCGLRCLCRVLGDAALRRKLGGLYSKCDKAAIKVDMIVDALVTVILEFSKTVLRRVAKSS